MGCCFHGSKLVIFMENFQNVSSVYTKNSLVGNNERHLEQQFGKSMFSLGLYGIQILRVSYMSDLGKLFDSSRNKIKGFEKFKNFQCFRVFVLSYRSNQKRLKQQRLGGSRLFWVYMEFKFLKSVIVNACNHQFKINLIRIASSLLQNYGSSAKQDSSGS